MNESNTEYFVPGPDPGSIFSKIEVLDESARETIEQIIEPDKPVVDLKQYKIQMEHVQSFTRTSGGEMSFATGFDDWWRNLDQQRIDNLHQILDGKNAVLVDVGGGLMPMVVPELAKKIGVRTYIDIDIRLTSFDTKGELPVEVFGPQKIYLDDEKEISAVAIGDDSLRFLARLKDGSVSLMMSGIDENIVISPEYELALLKEVKRVVPSGGLILGGTSFIYPYLKNDEEFENIFDGKLRVEDYTKGMIFAFKKKQIHTQVEANINEVGVDIVYPYIEGDLASLESNENITIHDIESVMDKYWSETLKSHLEVNGNNVLLNVEKACEKLKGRFGNYVINGTLVDLVDKRSRVIYPVFNYIYSASMQCIERLIQAHPDTFPADTQAQVMEMYSSLNHNFKGDVNLIIMDAAEKIREGKIAG